MKDQRLQAARMEKLMKAQAEAAASQVLPTFEGAAAAPTASSADLDATAQDARMRAARRAGLNKTVFAGNTRPAPAPSTVQAGAK